MSPQQSPAEFFKKYQKPILIGAAALVVVLLFSGWLVKKSVTLKGNRTEAELTSQYNDNIGQLSTCITTSRQAAGVALQQTKAFDLIIEDAVSGRYQDNSSADGVGRGLLFSAIQENYPDLTKVGGTFDKVMEVVVGCRKDYQQYQEKLQLRLAEFDKWRNGTFLASIFGDFPNDNLVAESGSEILRGQDAYDKMRHMVSTSAAQRAYQSGTLEEEDPFAPSDGG